MILMVHENTSKMGKKKIINEINKKNILSIYNALATCNNLSDIYSNIPEKAINNDIVDRGIYKITDIVINYNKYKENNNNDFGRKDNNYLERTLKALFNACEVNDEMQGEKINKLVSHICNAVKSGDSLGTDALLKRANAQKIIGVREDVFISNKIFQSLSLKDSLAKTLFDSFNEGGVNQLINDVYKQHIMPNVQSKYSLLSKMMSKQTTLESRLDQTDVNDLINRIRVKHPYAFKDNELYSFKYLQKEKDDLYSNTQELSGLLNNFGLIPAQHINVLLDTYTDTYYLKQGKFIEKFDLENCIQFVGKTEIAVKYLITGHLTDNIYDDLVDNSKIKVFRVSSMVMQNEADNHYNKIGLEQLFNYCKNNNFALLINHDHLDEELLKVYPVFKEVAANYKSTVYLMDEGPNSEAIFKLLEWRDDLKSLINSYNEVKLLNKKNKNLDIFDY